MYYLCNKYGMADSFAKNSNIRKKVHHFSVLWPWAEKDI